MTKNELPRFITPMLALRGQPFDSDQHLFEIKWDGTRAVVYVDAGGYRIFNRRRFEISERYPEFSFLGALAPGTVLDGEIVVLDAEGKADFPALQSREQQRSRLRIATASRAVPATFIAFDQLYVAFESVMKLPLSERRSHLLHTVQAVVGERIFASDGVVGPGTEFFRQVTARGMEGIIAKRLSSTYQPGKRTEAWIKIKKSSHILCAIIGYVPSGDDFESLLLAAADQESLRYVGRVGTGFDFSLRCELNRLLRARHTDRPPLPINKHSQGVTAGLYCEVRYMEQTRSGELRDPVFVKLISSP